MLTDLQYGNCSRVPRGMLRSHHPAEPQSACVKQKSVLPYGSTLHSHDCGCPERWSKGARAADVVDILFQQAFSKYQQGILMPCRHLTVAYMLPHHNVVTFSLATLLPGAPATTDSLFAKSPNAAVPLATDWRHEVPGRACEVLDLQGPQGHCGSPL